MHALNVAWKDIQVYVRDRSWLIELFFLPLLFIVIVSGALTALTAPREDEGTRLVVVDLDGGPVAQRLLADLDAAGGVRVEILPQDEVLDLLQERQVGRVLTLPAGLSEAEFGRSPGDRRPVMVRLTTHPDANPEQSEAVRLLVEGVVQDLLLEQQIIASLEQLAAMQAMTSAEHQALTAERIIAQAEAQFEHARERPLVTLVQRPPSLDGDESEARGLPDAVQLAVPGFAVLFVFLTAQATAGSIYEEKRRGTFRRLLAAPLSRGALLAGKMLPNFFTALVQTAVIFAFGLVGLRLMGLQPLSLGNAPGALLLVAIAMALCSSGLGILIAALARTEGQIGGLSSLVLWGAGILGGSFVPLFLLERFLGPLSRIVPHYWANRAFENLLLRGLGLGDVIGELLALLGFTALFFVVGLWRFRFEGAS